jgi:YVTN family beta-propeller protein
MLSHGCKTAMKAAVLLLFATAASAQTNFMNFETPVIHPVALSPDASTLAVCNLPDARVEIFDVTTGTPDQIDSIPVGIDPVTVRFRTNSEIWVVNHISDSVSVVDLTAGRVVATLQTKDEPCDVVFANGRAFVSCSQANTIQVFDAVTRALTNDLAVTAEEPKAMAVSGDGTEVYVAVFESGNHSTILGGGGDGSIGVPPNVVETSGPYFGENPPFDNSNPGGFDPPKNPGNGSPPDVGLIVKKDPNDNLWKDFQGGDWTSVVSGASASASARVPGWDLYDHDVVVIDTDSLAVTYATWLMNSNMAIGVNPASGMVTVVGTDGTNEIRFEPNITGKFTKVLMATVDPSDLSKTVVDLNAGHLDYSSGTIIQTERDKSIGDPRGIVWNTAGTKGYVSGLGSNNVIVIDSSGARTSVEQIDIGEGPTGLVLDESRDRLYVLNRFGAEISVIDTDTDSEVHPRVPLHDATDLAIRVGRKHLYDTHKTSGLGQISCASCHIDSRMDRLAWDLGDPTGTVKALDDPGLPGTDLNLGAGMPGLTTNFTAFHPMKGPMSTQTLQDIIGKEPLHWRGDRLGIEEFNPAFIGLNGDDAMLTTQEMQEFEDLLATIHFPPNPFRNFDNTLPSNLPIPGHLATGRHALPRGSQLPDGNPQQGLELYRGTSAGSPFDRDRLDSGAFTCVQCHTLPTGMGTDFTLVGSTFVQIAPNASDHPTAPGARHIQIVSVDQSTQRAIKTPHVRNAYEKFGFEYSQTMSLSGFGFLHDGSVDSLAQFVDEPVFTIANDQVVADLVAFVLCITGSDLPEGTTAADTSNFIFEPPGPPSNDAHAAVGKQVTITDGNAVPMFGFADIIAEMISLADDDPGRVDLVAHGVESGENRGWTYNRATDMFDSDRDGESLTPAALRALASASAELTYTVIYRGAGTRVGIDRDGDGYGNRTELDLGSDPADAGSIPAPPDIDIAGSPVFFGIHFIERGASAPQSVTIANVSNSPLNFTGNGIEITGTDAADFAFDPDPSTAQLGGLDMRVVSIVFDPSTEGEKNATLVITTDDPDEPTVNVPIVGISAPLTESLLWKRYE